MQYIKGIHNVLPNFLSRTDSPFLDSDAALNTKTPQTQISLNELSSLSRRKKENYSFVSSMDPITHSKLEMATFIAERLNKNCPEPQIRAKLLEKYHKLGHWGANGLYRALWHDNYFWPNLMRDCINTVAGCPNCLANNVAKRGYHLLRCIDAKYPFDHVIVDLAEPVGNAKGEYNYILVLIDVSTRFVILKRLRNKSSETVARKLLAIFCTFGFPKIFQSDNGAEFENAIIKELLRISEQRFSCAYNPQQNGLVEKAVGTTKHLLRKYLYENSLGDDWSEYVPMIQLLMNIKIAEINQSAPFSLMFLRPANLPSDYRTTKSELIPTDVWLKGAKILTETIFPALEKNREIFNEKLKKQFERRHRILLDQLPLGTKVMFQNHARTRKLDPPFKGPYTIVHKGRDGYVLMDDTGATTGAVPPQQLKLLIPQPADVTTRPEEILSHALDTNNVRWFLVKWKGYPILDASWLKEGDPMLSESLLQKYPFSSEEERGSVN